MTKPHQSDQRFDLAAVAIGAALALIGAIEFREPMAVAFFALAAVVVALPLALDRAYAIACVPIVLGVAWSAGVAPAIVVAAVAFSLCGGVRVLVACRVLAHLAIAAMLAQALLLLTWPLWAARLLLRFDVQPLVDLAVRFGPLFAINRAIDPTDAFTHRPGAYEWMNLGQDVPYALPATIWPCVLLHGSIGVVGALVAQKGRDTNRHESHESPRRHS